MTSNRRLRKEWERLVANPIEHLTIAVSEEDPLEWHADLVGAPETIYEGEAYRLRFRFATDYPLSAPEVVFLEGSPEHEHIYSNGHICLSILADEWSPALTVQSVCLSILSMMSSAREKKRPPDDRQYSTARAFASPKNTRWDFHDDNV